MDRMGSGSFVRPRRFAGVALALVALMVVLTARLYDLQIVNGARYRALAEHNRILRIPVPADRGFILDRSGHVLARNLPGFGVGVIPIDVPVSQETELAVRLAPILGREAESVRAAIALQRKRNPFEPVRVSLKPVSRDIALLLAERAELYPGVRVDPESLRIYDDGALYAPLLGYIGPITEEELGAKRSAGYLTDDDIGRTGLERVYESYLRGTYGWREIERDAAQREVKTLALVPSRAGGNVQLTIDDRLQKLIAAELDRGVRADAFTQGVGVAIDPRNGEILAMVSTPSYDNNLFVRGITAPELSAILGDNRRVLVNKAVGDIFPPGSTFKLVPGVAALNEGTATRNTVVNVTSNVMQVGAYRFFDWTVHGPVDFVNGFAHSSDIYFYTLAGGNPSMPQHRPVGPEALAKYGRMLGFGAPTGIDLPGEAAGIMPDPVWKEDLFDEPWTIGNTYQMAIGQGFVAVTPLQLLNAYAAIANGGTLYRPHLLRRVLDPGGATTVTKEPEIIRKLDITDDHLRLMREASRRVVTVGHAVIPNPKLPIAGKTGTAEFGPSQGQDSAGRNLLGFHNWFVSFVPKQDNTDPTAEIAMVVFTFDSSRSMCELCLNPAVGITQRVLEAYLAGR